MILQYSRTFKLIMSRESSIGDLETLLHITYTIRTYIETRTTIVYFVTRDKSRKAFR